MKDIKKMLAEEGKSVLPDAKVKENIRKELGITETESAIAYAHSGEAAANKKSRTPLIAACAALVAAVLFLSIFLPLFLNRNGGSLTIGNKFEQITGADSFYAYGAASVGSLLSAENGAQAATGSVSKSLSRTRAQTAAQASGASDEAQIELLSRYMTLVEGLLGEGGITETAIGGNGDYEFGMTVTYTDLLGAPVSYTMYYDKIFRGGETDGDEREENYAIEGVLLAGGAEYPVEGNYETETESGGGESETGSELYFKAYTGENSYIEVEQESESETEGNESEEEKEYAYSVYENGRLIERTTVEYESEEGELELVMTIEKDGERETLTFSGETVRGELVLRVTGNIGGERVRFSIYVREGQYHYVFEDGSSSDHDRYDDDDDDEDD